MTAPLLRSAAVLALAGAVAAVTASEVFAQAAFPTRQVTVISPTGPGSATGSVPGSGAGSGDDLPPHAASTARSENARGEIRFRMRAD